MISIIKKDGSKVAFNPTKIHNRIKKAAKGLKVSTDALFVNVMTSMPMQGDITTKQLDTLVAETAASFIGEHYDYSKLAAVVSISSHNKTIDPSFSKTMKKIAAQDQKLNQLFLDKIEKYGEENLDAIIDNTRDELFDYFAWKALSDTYLLKDENGKLAETPQQMFLRTAIWVTDSFKEAKDLYNSLSHYTSPATPIILNSGVIDGQLASCVLIMNSSDSREGLIQTFNEVANYSADAAGIGLCLSNIRSKESKIKKSGGRAGGWLKYVKIINEGLRFFNQQGKRPGSAAVYIEPWHLDIFDVLDIKKNSGKDELRARDIFTALSLPDNFMHAVKNNTEWYLFCPNDIAKAGLKPFYEIYGEEYEQEYNKAVSLGIGKKIMAREIWKKILESQIETGVPYLLAKDSVNRKSNQKNIGTIKQSNLCIEIVEYTDKDTIAMCNLSSHILKNYVVNGEFNYLILYEETCRMVRYLNNVIDINHYSTEKGRKGGLEQRAIAIGVQGLADVFFLLDLAFTSPEAKLINKKIFETIYFAALSESMRLCKSGEREPYKYFEGSPLSQGQFQFNLWGLSDEEASVCEFWDWRTLREDIMKYGVCNSLVTGKMPTASSARMYNSVEMDEPQNANIFSRSVNGGEFIIVNKYLIEDFEKLGIWNTAVKNAIISKQGSIQDIDFSILLDPEDKRYEKKVKRLEFLKEKYKTIWEIKQKDLIDMTADRGVYIDQSQSTNIYFADGDNNKISSSHFYAWEKGLKTICYYLRTQPISTGDKSLAFDASESLLQYVNEQKINDAPSHFIPKSKSADSDVDCFGCGS